MTMWQPFTQCFLVAICTWHLEKINVYTNIRAVTTSSFGLLWIALQHLNFTSDSYNTILIYLLWHVSHLHILNIRSSLLYTNCKLDLHSCSMQIQMQTRYLITHVIHQHLTSILTASSTHKADKSVFRFPFLSKNSYLICLLFSNTLSEFDYVNRIK